jgi:ABC-type nitrate/sulfonate/bicarbonate transport system ATPase subunit
MITLEGVYKRFGETQLFRNLDFQFPPGSVNCLIGPSGCGKTTFLNLVSGLVTPDEGRVVIRGRVSCVFQEARLLPWSTVRENAMYAMSPRLGRQERSRRAEEILEVLELGDTLEMRPRELSGGMARRVSLARALLADYDIILLDEPLSSLDPQLRSRVTEFLSRELEGKTVVLVTHNYSTAAALADRVFHFSSPPVSITELQKNDIEGMLKRINEMNHRMQDPL